MVLKGISNNFTQSQLPVQFNNTQPVKKCSYTVCIEDLSKDNDASWGYQIRLALVNTNI